MEIPERPGSDLAKVCDYARKQIGLPYVWGGNGPDFTPPSRGFDCSGLTMMAYRQIGITIPRTATLQANYGAEIKNRAVMAPGDLVFPPFNPRPHVFIYVGEGKCVEAPRTGLNVRLIDLPGKGGIWRVRRIVKASGEIPGTDYEGPNPLQKPWLEEIPVVNSIDDAVKAIGKAVGFFTSEHNWYRAGIFVLGSGLIVVGIRSVST